MSPPPLEIKSATSTTKRAHFLFRDTRVIGAIKSERDANSCKRVEVVE